MNATPEQRAAFERAEAAKIQRAAEREARRQAVAYAREQRDEAADRQARQYQARAHQQSV